MAHTSGEAHHCATASPTAGAAEPSAWLSVSLGPLRERPLASFAALFILGVAFAPSVHVPTYAVFMAAALLICAAVALARLRRGLGACTMALAFVAGVAWQAANATIPADDVSRWPLPTQAEVRGTLAGAPLTRDGRSSFVLRVAGIKRGGTWQEASGKLRVFCSEPGEGMELGAKVEFDAWLRPIASAMNPGEINYARYLARQGIRAEALVGAHGLRRWEQPPRPTLGSIAGEMRDTAQLALYHTMPGANRTLYASLVASMVYGVTAAPLPPEIVERFRQSGTIHVLVVSGAQVSLLAVSLLLLLRARRGVLWWWQALLVLPVLALFAVMVGYGPSVRRAVSMCMLLLFAGTSRRDYDPYTALALAAVMIVLIDPTATQDVGAQLSFAAAFGVIHFLPRRRARFDGAGQPLEEASWRRYVQYVIGGSFGAWVMVVPILAHHFHSFPTLSALSNLVVVPLASLLVVTGFLATIAALVLPPVAIGLNWLNGHLVDAVLAAVRVGAGLPLSYETRTYMPVLAVVVWYAAVVAVVAIARSEWRQHLTWRNAVLLVLLLCALALAYHAATMPSPQLTVTVLDVGDGDCIVVRSPTGETMLVDAGEPLRRGQPPDVGQRVLLPYLLLHGIRRLDYVVATHAHDDHISGLPAVLRDVPVGQVLDCGLPGQSEAYEAYVEALRRRHVPRRAVRWGERLSLGGGAVAAVLAPAQPLVRGTPDDPNNNSVVLKLVYGDVSFLLTGDVEAEGQARLLRSGANLRASVLKVPHHGAVEACTPEFLEAVSPRWALISASGHLGHPAPETVEQLQAVGATVVRTDTDGAITVETDGRHVRIRTYAPAAAR